MNEWLPGLSGVQNLHPMVTHFPIVCWIGALLAWGVASLGEEREQWWLFGRWLHMGGGISALVAIAFGFIASDRLGHDSPGHDLVHVHRNFMLVATGISVIICIAGWKMRSATLTRQRVLTAFTLVLVGVMVLGADRGAALVFVHGVGVETSSPTPSGLPGDTTPTGSHHDHGGHTH